MDALTIVLFLAIANMNLVDYLVGPIKKRWPDHDYWYLTYVALVTGGVIGWISQANVFGEYIPALLAGRILTSILVGGGASLIHNIFDKDF